LSKPRDPAGAVFLALSDPTRRDLLATIAERPATTATELASHLPISRQAVVKHLGTLTEAGLLERETAGREVRYRMTPAPFSEAVSWMAEVGGQWDERLAALARTFGARPGRAAGGRAASGPPAARQRGEMPR
jgi:DNA-binding transcriptional ArsR family regulator